MPEFTCGLDRSEVLYRETVRPLIDLALPDLPHSAALLGTGSEVLGYDTVRSTDHDYHPRVQILVRPGCTASVEEALEDALLEHSIQGVRVLTVRELFYERLGVDPMGPVEATDWLTFSEQSLLEVTRGRVFHDGLGSLGQARRRFAYYPDDVWRYLLAAQWRRIAQEEHFPGRAAEVGDELGSRVIVARLVRDLMRLAFLLERTYAPYPKWFGSSFAKLTIAERLTPPLARALDSGAWEDREDALCEAYEIVAEEENQLGIHEAVEAKVSRFHNRPFRVIHGNRFSEAIRGTIEDEAVLALPDHLGGADQISDSTDLLSYPALRSRIRVLYCPPGTPVP